MEVFELHSEELSIDDGLPVEAPEAMPVTCPRCESEVPTSIYCVACGCPLEIEAPMRRAARFDGVYPARDWPDTLSVEDLRGIIGYIKEKRTSLEPFDVVAGGSTPSDPEKGSDLVEPWTAAGATWWSEDINGWRGSLDEMRERIRAGPPRA